MTKCEKEKSQLVMTAKRQLVELGITRRELANETGLSDSTVNHFFSGVSSDDTKAKIAKVLKIPKILLDNPMGVAPESHGSYLREDYSGYRGEYLMVRPVLGPGDELCVFPMKIDWSDENQVLTIHGLSEDGQIASATIAIPKSWPYLSFHHVVHGHHSLIITSTMTHEGVLFGMMLTLGLVVGQHYAPTVVPVIFETVPQKEIDHPRLITHADEDYSRYRSLLSRVSTDGYGVFKAG